METCGCADFDFCRVVSALCPCVLLKTETLDAVTLGHNFIIYLPAALSTCAELR